MDGFNTCNPRFQLDQIRGFQLSRVAHISDGRANLQRECELGNVNIAIDIAISPTYESGKVIFSLRFTGVPPKSRIASPRRF